jgi:hypothetical protein
VIEHTPDPLRFLDAVATAVAGKGQLIVVCPDGSRPGLELLFADHLFSFNRAHLESLLGRAGMAIVSASLAPPSLGAFQMVVGRHGPNLAPRSVSVAARVRARAEYLQRWRDLDGRLLARLGPTAVCFGAGEAAGLLRAYAPRSWTRVVACTADVPTGASFGGVPIVPLDTVDEDVSLLLGVRPDVQRPLAERLQTRFRRVVEWYDLVDEHHG